MKHRAWSVERRVAVGIAGFLSLGLPLFAQQTDFNALNNSVLRFPALMLADAGLFSFPNAFSWIEPRLPDFLPALPSTARQRTNASSSATTGKDSSKEVVDIQRNLFDYVHGEVGFLYGHSSGKFGREVEAGYIVGEVGDDKFHITVGASYENSNGRLPRLGR
jgi:hypothetical protein